MKRFIALLIVVVLGVMSFGSVRPVFAASPANNQIKITTVFLGSISDAGDEYVVIKNLSPTAVDINGMEVDYKSATGKSWYTKARITTSRIVPPFSSVMAASKRVGDIDLSSGMAQVGGNIRVLLAGVVVDSIAWGNGDTPEGHSAVAPRPGEELMRQCDSAQICQDSQDNLADFSIVGIPSQDQPGKGGNLESQSVAQIAQNISSGASIEITELMPDPVSPQLDSKDEFIELYNAGSNPATLTGWKLTEGKHSFSLDKVIINPGQYIAIFARDSKLSLNNSGDTVSLIDSSGQSVMTTPNYTKAQAGKSFGATSQGWGWLSTPTPGTTNSELATDQNTEQSS